jgi:iron(III) transport system ATP-binding protein
VLRDGKIAQYAPPEELYAHPADPDLATFIGDANLLDGILAADSVDTILGKLSYIHNGTGASPDSRVTVLVRPEQIELRSDGDGTRARIVSYGYHGHDAVVGVQPEQGAGGQTILVRVIGGQSLPVSSPVTLHARGPVLAWPKELLTSALR